MEGCPGDKKFCERYFKALWGSTRFQLEIPQLLTVTPWPPMSRWLLHFNLSLPLMLDAINSLSPGWCGSDFKCVILQHILMINMFSIPSEIALRWMSQDHIDDKSILAQVMACCHQAPRHYLKQCWPSSMSPYGITRGQWVNSLWPSDARWRQKSGSTLA